MSGKKKNLQRVVLNLPPKTAATLEYLISIAQVARTKSDLVIQLLNEYIDKKRDTLNDTPSWRDFTQKLDSSKQDKVDQILSAFVSNEEDEGDDEEEE